MTFQPRVYEYATLEDTIFHPEGYVDGKLNIAIFDPDTGGKMRAIRFLNLNEQLARVCDISRFVNFTPGTIRTKMAFESDDTHTLDSIATILELGVVDYDLRAPGAFSVGQDLTGSRRMQTAPIATRLSTRREGRRLIGMGIESGALIDPCTSGHLFLFARLPSSLLDLCRRPGLKRFWRVFFDGHLALKAG